jgi:hypothetical protein
MGVGTPGGIGDPHRGVSANRSTFVASTHYPRTDSGMTGPSSPGGSHVLTWRNEERSANPDRWSGGRRLLDEHRIVVGSHSGLGVFSPGDGTRLDRVEDLDGEYGWLREAPLTAAYTDGEGRHLVAIVGLWGGSLS